MNWNDDRLDHFAEQVDKRFEQVDERFDKFEAHVDARFNRLEDRFEKRFDTLQQSMIITLASILTAFAALVAATIF
ncbi:MAG: hypothetical protein ACM3N0_00340 [Chloroflexota bacterium]